jgi:hypothetical protein
MSLFKKPGELEVTTTIKALIYGQPGIGKSTLALSAPNPVLLDFDGGVQRVNGAFQCPTLQVSSWEEVIEAIDELKKGEVECDTIVIDTAGKMLDYMGDFIIRNDEKMKMRDGSLSLKGYGARKVMFINFLKDVSMMGKHLVFVAHEKEDKDGEIRIVRPEMGGSSLGDLIKELDLVGYMQAIGTKRTVSWSPTEKFYAKNACNLPAVHAVEEIIDTDGNVTGENKFMTYIFDNYIAYLGQLRQHRQKYDNLLASLKKGIAAVKDEKTANECFAKIEGFDKHIWDSKAQAEKALQVKCESIGLKFNEIEQKYEAA